MEDYEFIKVVLISILAALIPSMLIVSLVCFNPIKVLLMVLLIAALIFIIILLKGLMGLSQVSILRKKLLNLAKHYHECSNGYVSDYEMNKLAKYIVFYEVMFIVQEFLFLIGFFFIDPLLIPTAIYFLWRIYTCFFNSETSYLTELYKIEYVRKLEKLVYFDSQKFSVYVIQMLKLVYFFYMTIILVNKIM